ncbi:hypothetical protein J4219_02705 [Candidatus Woesearchaeota archaeon]|nr:hypothetical protein [Candidatus Woesearchaeota archaeon]
MARTTERTYTLASGSPDLFRTALMSLPQQPVYHANAEFHADGLSPNVRSTEQQVNLERRLERKNIIPYSHITMTCEMGLGFTTPQSGIYDGRLLRCHTNAGLTKLLSGGRIHTIEISSTYELDSPVPIEFAKAAPEFFRHLFEAGYELERAKFAAEVYEGQESRTNVCTIDLGKIDSQYHIYLHGFRSIHSHMQPERKAAWFDWFKSLEGQYKGGMKNDT